MGKHVPPDGTGWKMQRTGSSQNMWPSDSLLLVRTWFSSTNSIDWSSKKEGDFSLARTAVRIAPNCGASPPRHICTISSSSMFTPIEPSESQSSLIFKVNVVIDMSLCWMLFNSWRSLLRIKLKRGLVREITLRVNRHSNGQESPLCHHYVF